MYISDFGDSRQDSTILQPTEKTNAVTCYENEVPDFVETELERLYGNLFSSLPYLGIYGKLTQGTSTCVIRNDDEITTIFLFQLRGRHAKVINEGMKISAEELRLFSIYIFSEYKSVDFISFDAVMLPVEQIPWTHQRISRPCELVLELPDTEEEYLASLSKHFRTNIKRALTRLPAEHPSFRIDFYDAADVKESHIHSIIDLNKTRMGCVKKVYKREQDEVQRLTKLCKSLGLVGVMTIEGKVCGGSIGYRVGNSHFGGIISHEAKYDKYSLGTLCIFLCIRECIARGYKQFNFMSGNNDYKASLGGLPRDLENVLVYRSRAKFLLNPDVAVKMLLEKILGQARLTVQLKLSALGKLKLQGKLDTRSKLLFLVLDSLRSLKDHLPSLPKRH
jgi:hypothetical protein